MNNYSIHKSYKTFKLDISINLLSHGIVVLQGDSGCGKTTILNILSGNLKDDYNEFLNLNSFFLEAHSQLPSHKKVKDILTMVESENQCKISNNVLQLLNLDDKLNQKIKRLSDGEKKLVCFALSILSSKSVILMDEPHVMIHEDMINKQISILQELAKNKLIIIATHKGQYYRNIAKVIYTLQNGKIVKEEYPIQQIFLSECIVLHQKLDSKKQKLKKKLKFHFPVFLYSTLIMFILCAGMLLLISNQTFLNATKDDDFNRYKLGLFAYDHKTQLTFDSELSNEDKNQIVKDIAKQEDLKMDYEITLIQYYLMNLQGENEKPYHFNSNFDFHYFYKQNQNSLITGKKNIEKNEIYVSLGFMDYFDMLFPSFDKEDIHNFLDGNHTVTFYNKNRKDQSGLKIEYNIAGIIQSS